MSSRLEPTDRVITGILAGAIVVVLLGGIVGGFAVNSDSNSPGKKSQSQPVDEAERQRQAQAARDAQSVDEANAAALKSIISDQELCKTKYLADAQARAAQAAQQLKEQGESLR